MQIAAFLVWNGQRWSRRIAVDIPVEVAAVGSPTIHGHLKDLSLSGALVTTDHALPLHAYIEISIKPLKAEQRAVRVMARVTRNLEGGVGVEWCEFAPSAVTDLLRSPSF
jgi:PilZ domain